ncbi:MAG: hypothetical protein WD227_01790 [Vicinamibacterales bacterium]
MRRRQLVWFALVFVLLPMRAVAQTTPAADPAPTLRVFLDCHECDSEFLRQHVTFVDYVRDRAASDLHVLVTTQSTGGGGSSWTVRFIGLGRFQGVDRVHPFSTPQAATGDDRRREFARVFRLGVSGYAAETPSGRDLEVTWKPPAAVAATAPLQDRWHRWVFRVNGNGSLNGEKANTSYRYSLGSSANRVTEEWKLSANGNFTKNESRFTLTDGRRVTSGSNSWSGTGLVVKSLGPHLSAGARVSTSHSSFSNVDRSISLLPGVEYDLFPYADFQRRSLTVWYEIGPTIYNYKELTVFDKTRETTLKHNVDVTLAMRQPWGSLYSSARFSQRLRQRDRYTASVFGSTDVRVFKGLSFNLYVSYSKIKDQSSLQRAEASTEEVLLRIRQLATNHRYSYSVGLSYNFGSIFTSIVNPRFSGSNTFFFF